MAEFSQIQGVAAPLSLNNLDTDQIMPKQFLLGIDKSGLAHGVLHDLRFDANEVPRPDFVLNKTAYRDANILLTGSNFGCGSSREHAVWGLMQIGIQAVIAPSFGEIFYFNAANNRLLLVTLPEDAISELMSEIADPASSDLVVDVAREVVVSASGKEYRFSLPARQKAMFLEGLDMVGASLKQMPQIKAFEQKLWACNPWLKVDLPAMRKAG